MKFSTGTKTKIIKTKTKYINIDGKNILVLKAKTNTYYLKEDKENSKSFLSFTITEKCPFCGYTHSYQDNQDIHGIQRDTDGIFKSLNCVGKRFKKQITLDNGVVLNQSDGVYLSIKDSDIYIAPELRQL